jgi:hypothetical protein
MLEDMIEERKNELLNNTPKRKQGDILKHIKSFIESLNLDKDLDGTVINLCMFKTPAAKDYVTTIHIGSSSEDNEESMRNVYFSMAAREILDKATLVCLDKRAIEIQAACEKNIK